MAVQKIRTDMSEAERRKLVAGIAKAGTRATNTAQAVKDSGAGQAAAAAANVLADPVDLGPAATSALAAKGGKPGRGASRYADAQRAIFQGSINADLAAGNTYYDGAARTAGAVNYKLEEYDADLAAAADEAERAKISSRRRGGGGGGGGGGGDDFIFDPEVDISESGPAQPTADEVNAWIDADGSLGSKTGALEDRVKVEMAKGMSFADATQNTLSWFEAELRKQDPPEGWTPERWAAAVPGFVAQAETWLNGIADEYTNFTERNQAEQYLTDQFARGNMDGPTYERLMREVAQGKWDGRTWALGQAFSKPAPKPIKTAPGH